MPRLFPCFIGALAEKQPFALAILSRVKGSSPQKTGAKALFFGDGRIIGTLGGGCLEAEIQDRARRALLTGIATSFELLLDHDFGWDDGLICGGKVSGIILPRAAEAASVWERVTHAADAVTWGVRPEFSIEVSDDCNGPWLYKETVFPPTPLWIAGSGHVAQAVAPLAGQLDFYVTVFDDRPALANHAHFPACVKFEVGSWEKILEVPSPSTPAFGLIVTRGHQHDALVLRNWIQRPFAFLGMIGSRRKARLIFNQFLEENLATEAQIARVFCPVGLDIAAQSVSEIAVSICAQLIEQRALVHAPRGSEQLEMAAETDRVLP